MSGFKFNLGALPGNGALARQLSAKESLSHAYILSGPPGSGKHALAVLLAQAMVCAAPGDWPCLDCPACRKAAAGIHPDVTTVAPAEGKRDIVVEQSAPSAPTPTSGPTRRPGRSTSLRTPPP